MKLMMRRKNVLKLSFLIVFLTLLWSCHNEDFAQAEKNPQRNNQDFFKHTKNNDTFARAGVDYIDILDAYNKEKDFLAQMPDQDGMPIWEKMMVFETETKTALFIPLSYDKSTMSSILFVNIDENKNVKGVRNIDNAMLENIVTDIRQEVSVRESLMSSFLMLDQHTFGTKEFTNIPDGLFKDGVKGKYNRLYITQFNNEVNNDPQTGKIIITSCQIVWACKQNKTWEECDKCGTCLKKTNCQHYFLDGGDGTIPLPEITTLPPSGGGASPNPNTPPKPTDPCGLQTVFYRMVTSCQGNGSGDDEVFGDPCEEIQNQRNEPTFNNNITNLQGKTTLKKETGYFQKNDGVYGYMDNATATDEANQLAMPDLSYYNYIKGYMHTHPNDYYYTNSEGYTIEKIGIKIFSPTDVIYFMKMLKNAKFTGKPLGGVYGIMVASMNNYQIRFTGTPTQIKEFTEQQEMKLNEDFAEDMKNKKNKVKTLELGFLTFLEEKMNIAGVNLYRMNTDGTTTEIHLNPDKTDTVENNCPI